MAKHHKTSGHIIMQTRILNMPAPSAEMVKLATEIELEIYQEALYKNVSAYFWDLTGIYQEYLDEKKLDTEECQQIAVNDFCYMLDVIRINQLDKHLYKTFELGNALLHLLAKQSHPACEQLRQRMRGLFNINDPQFKLSIYSENTEMPHPYILRLLNLAKDILTQCVEKNSVTTFTRKLLPLLSLNFKNAPPYEMNEFLELYAQHATLFGEFEVAEQCYTKLLPADSPKLIEQMAQLKALREARDKQLAQMRYEAAIFSKLDIFDVLCFHDVLYTYEGAKPLVTSQAKDFVNKWVAIHYPDTFVSFDTGDVRDTMRSLLARRSAIRARAANNYTYMKELAKQGNVLAIYYRMTKKRFSDKKTAELCESFLSKTQDIQKTVSDIQMPAEKIYEMRKEAIDMLNKFATKLSFMRKSTALQYLQRALPAGEKPVDLSTPRRMYAFFNIPQSVVRGEESKTSVDVPLLQGRFKLQVTI